MSFPLKEKGKNLLSQLLVENLVLEDTGLWEFIVKWKTKDTEKWKKGAVIPLNISIDN